MVRQVNWRGWPSSSVNVIWLTALMRASNRVALRPCRWPPALAFSDKPLDCAWIIYFVVVAAGIRLQQQFLFRRGPYESAGSPGDHIMALSLKRRIRPKHIGSANSANLGPGPKPGEGTLSQERLLKMELKGGERTRRVREHLLEMLHGLP